jgi:hypothetical protein
MADEELDAERSDTDNGWLELLGEESAPEVENPVEAAPHRPRGPLAPPPGHVSPSLPPLPGLSKPVLSTAASNPSSNNSEVLEGLVDSLFEADGPSALPSDADDDEDEFSVGGSLIGSASGLIGILSEVSSELDIGSSSSTDGGATDDSETTAGSEAEDDADAADEEPEDEADGEAAPPAVVEPSPTSVPSAPQTRAPVSSTPAQPQGWGRTVAGFAAGVLVTLIGTSTCGGDEADPVAAEPKLAALPAQAISPSLPPMPVAAAAPEPPPVAAMAPVMEAFPAEAEGTETGGEEPETFAPDVAAPTPEVAAPPTERRPRSTARTSPPVKPEAAPAPKPKPEPKPAPKPAPAAKESSAEELLLMAEQALDSGDTRNAYRHARASYGKKKLLRANEIMAEAACRRRDKRSAKAAFDRIKFGKRLRIKRICAKNGVEL